MSLPDDVLIQIGRIAVASAWLDQRLAVLTYRIEDRPATLKDANTMGVDKRLCTAIAAAAGIRPGDLLDQAQALVDAAGDVRKERNRVVHDVIGVTVDGDLVRVEPPERRAVTFTVEDLKRVTARLEELTGLATQLIIRMHAGRAGGSEARYVGTPGPG